MKNLPKIFTDEIEAGYISCRPHPHLPLFVLNYTPSAQFDRRWNSATMQARGLIVDVDGNIVSRPFQKFFNLSEHDSPELPDVPYGESFVAYEKMDGSLAISYPTPDGLAISTRGSFTSDQATKGTQLLRSKYSDALSLMDPELTYLFEIIYPANRIVVVYDDEELVLLGAIRTKTGEEIDLEDLRHLPFRQPQSFLVKSIDDLPKGTPNFEGYVIKYRSGLRVKVKLDEYVRIHRLVCDMSPRRTWECLKRGDDVDKLIADIPDELFDELNRTAVDLRSQFYDVSNEHRDLLVELRVDELDSRKDQAMKIVSACRERDLNPSALFCLLDSRDDKFDALMWDRVRP